MASGGTKIEAAGVSTSKSSGKVIPGLWDSYHNLSHSNLSGRAWVAKAAFTTLRPQITTMNDPIQTDSMNLKHIQTGLT